MKNLNKFKDVNVFNFKYNIVNFIVREERKRVDDKKVLSYEENVIFINKSIFFKLVLLTMEKIKSKFCIII